MKEQYHHLDLNNRNKWDVIRNEQPNGLDDYSKVDLQGKQWVSLKNPDIWKPKTEERREDSMENTFTPVEALSPAMVDRSTQLPPILRPYQSEPVEAPKPDRMKRAERPSGTPTNKERHALRDLAAGRNVEMKIDGDRMGELLGNRVQAEPLPLQEGLQAIDQAQQKAVGEVIVDFTK